MQALNSVRHLGLTMRHKQPDNTKPAPVEHAGPVAPRLVQQSALQTSARSQVFAWDERKVDALASKTAVDEMAGYCMETTVANVHEPDQDKQGSALLVSPTPAAMLSSMTVLFASMCSDSCNWRSVCC